MRLFSIRLRFLTPAIIATREGYQGMLYLGFSDKIPGSTVRGALLTWGIREGLARLEDVNREVRSPKHVVTTFMLSKGEANELAYRDVRLAHALSLKFKDGFGIDYIYSLGTDELLSTLKSGLSSSPTDALRELIARVSGSIDAGGNELISSVNTERVMGDSLVREGSNWVLASKYVSSGSYVGTGVDRVRRSVAPGVLFGYEYVESGASFVGMVMCDEGSVMCDLVDSLVREGASISVGKGVGRGYGLARIEVREVDTSVFGDLNVKEGDYLVFEVVGPAVTTDVMNNESPPLPRAPTAGDVLHSCVGSSCLELKVIATYGGIGEFRGWSLRLESPKLPLKALSYGSLVIARVGGDLGILRELPLIPTEPSVLSAQGLNILQSLPEDFIPKYGGGH